MVAKVLAIDVGYGFTKWTRRKDNTIAKGILPSIVVPKTESDLDGVNTDTSGICEVKTSSGILLCGSEIHRITYHTALGKKLSQDYPKTDEYEALLKCAILESDSNHIEKLVLGLPVDLMDLKDSLISKFQGVIEITGTKHNVSEVIVVPQPIGSYVQFQHSMPELSSEIEKHAAAVLFIDVGFGTIDWITVAENQVLPRRSGGSNIAVGEMLKFMADRIRATYGGDTIKDLEFLDKRLRGGLSLYFNQTSIPHEKLVEFSNEFNFSPVLKKINETIATFSDIRYVIMTGGGANYLAPQFRKKHDNLDLILLPDNNFSNVLGFLAIGESL